jgi:hypothetical protein
MPLLKEAVVASHGSVSIREFVFEGHPFVPFEVPAIIGPLSSCTKGCLAD